MEVRLAEGGEILSRGPDLFLGYLDDEQTARVFDEQGWYRTGDLAEAAVVAVPDARFGEIAGAVLRLRPAARWPTREQICEHFAAAGLARQKWPERLFEATDFPRTAGGKVRKHLIRGSIARRPLRHPDSENNILRIGE